jgi:hypothetical protein
VRLHHGIGLSLIVIIGALVLSAPATLLERLMPAEYPVRLADCSGTLLRSGACQVFLRVNSGWRHAGAVSYAWSVEQDHGLHLTLDHDGRRAGALHPSLDGWRVKDINLRTAILLPDVVPQYSIGAWQLTGWQVIAMPTLACDWRGSNCTGRARIEVIDLVIGRLSRDTVGSYALELEAHPGGRMSAQLTTLSGPLTLEGRMEKPPGGQMRITGQAKPGAGVSDEFRQVLAKIGRRKDPDTFAFSFPP